MEPWLPDFLVDNDEVGNVVDVHPAILLYRVFVYCHKYIARHSTICGVANFLEISSDLVWHAACCLPRAFMLPFGGKRMNRTIQYWAMCSNCPLLPMQRAAAVYSLTSGRWQPALAPSNLRSVYTSRGHLK
jgi:hypothetical protein